MSVGNRTKMLKFFKAGGNVICAAGGHVFEDSLSGVRGICRHDGLGYSRFWIKLCSSWLNLNKNDNNNVLTSDLVKESFPGLLLRHNSSSVNGTSTANNLVPSVAKVFVCDSVKEDFTSTILDKSKIKQANLVLDFKPTTISNAVPSSSYLPVLPGKSSGSSFDFNSYLKNLQTKTLGRAVIHCELVSTTFDVLDGPGSLWNGLAVIADQQYKGKGRGSNVWLSPRGCAMTSFQLEQTLSSGAGQKACLLQHVTSLALVHALRDHCQELRLKWPNDIYLGNKIKMGGVVAFSSVFRDTMTFNVGLGFNLDNEKPTRSLNRILVENGHDKLSREEFFARVFNELEKLMEKLESGDGGLQEVLDLYHQYWLHDQQRVKLIREESSSSGEPDQVDATVLKIDQDGFLVVKLDSNDEVVTVHPANNSFDLMQGLILPKKSK